jgi:hypothetical protein
MSDSLAKRSDAAASAASQRAEINYQRAAALNGYANALGVLGGSGSGSGGGNLQWSPLTGLAWGGTFEFASAGDSTGGNNDQNYASVLAETDAFLAQADAFIAENEQPRNWWATVTGVLQGVGGVAQAIGGYGFACFSAPTLAGALGGAIVGTLGVDQAIAGFRQAWSGQYQDSFVSGGLQFLGMGQDAANWADMGLNFTATAGLAAYSMFGNAAKTGTHWNPLNGPGPLGEKVAATFRGASYTESVTPEATTLYRVYGGKAGELGPYWTRTPPAGPLQSQIDNALLPQWGNTAQNVTRIQVPSGTTIFEGFAAPQGGLVGGGNQVFIPCVDPSWIIK